ncbi:MAG TPA: hypothetical protein VMV10_25135 [Pirellulales bacterium]|nr:hypothetical protein [Pirellulales bacterium]
MDAALIDTDILSEVIKGKHPQVLVSARKYLAVHQRLSFSAMTATVIYIPADLFISLRVQACKSAPHREILRENTRFAPRGAIAAAQNRAFHA